MARNIASIVNGLYTTVELPDIREEYERALQNTLADGANEDTALLRAHIAGYLKNAGGALTVSGDAMGSLAALIDKSTRAAEAAARTRAIQEGTMTKRDAATLIARVREVCDSLITLFVPAKDQPDANRHLQEKVLALVQGGAAPTPDNGDKPRRDRSIATYSDAQIRRRKRREQQAHDAAIAVIEQPT
jgi:hypothetical protein